MKKTVKPSMITVITFGACEIFCMIYLISDIIKRASLPFSDMLLFFLVTGVFVYFLLKFLSQKKIEFDENSFTVDGKSYSFEEISKITVDDEQLLRNVSTLRIRIYIGDEEICNFAKSDSCAKDLIQVMKSKELSVDIEV